MAVSGLSAGAHHRSGIIVAGGLGHIARRYAVDWKRRKDGAFFSGDPRDVRSYHAYGAEVLAVADATVVLAKDGLPDNIPRTAAGFQTAVPVTMETVAGNSAVLDWAMASTPTTRTSSRAAYVSGQAIACAVATCSGRSETRGMRASRTSTSR